jgi:hypothetical protein
MILSKLYMFIVWFIYLSLNKEWKGKANGELEAIAIEPFQLHEVLEMFNLVMK